MDSHWYTREGRKGAGEGKILAAVSKRWGGVKEDMVGWRLAAEFLLPAAWVVKIWASRVGDACFFFFCGEALI